MNENRLTDYLRHIEQAATDVCSFAESLTKETFLADKRSKSAVVMCLVVIGNAATKILDQDESLRGVPYRRWTSLSTPGKEKAL